MEKQQVKAKLTGVPETMLITLRAKYLETKRVDGIINDPKSVEILEQIDFDFSGKKEVSKGSQIGVAYRAELFDEKTNNFLANNNNAVVVNIGCGLDTRFHRLNNSSVAWFDLDVENAIEIRKNFFTESERNKFISKSVFDFSWIESIPKNKPTLFLAEGVLMYFAEEEVRSLFSAISDNFPDAEIIFDALSPFLAKRTKRHTDVKKYDAVFKWGLKSGKEIEQWNLRAKVIDEHYIFDKYRNRYPLILRVLAIIPVFRKGAEIVHLKIESNSEV